MLDITASSVTYRGGEDQSVFPIPFPFLESSHIRARLRDASGVTRALAAGVDYSINRISDENGEFILLGDALPEGDTLAITRLVPITQDIFFHNQGPNSPRAVETAADKLTMIAQQMDARLDTCLTVPDGLSAEEISQDIVDNAARVEELRQEVRTVKTGLAEKAAASHKHGVTDVETLPETLAGKVDSGTLTLALAEKADKTALAAKADASQLAAKADRVHAHAMADVAGLTTALAQKLDVDDPRLDGSAAPAKHARSHFADGDDPIRPEDIGTFSPPPSDGKKYLAVGGGWVEYIPPEGGGSSEVEGGTLDHSELLNRDAADQHPQSAIRYLSRDLESINRSLSDLSTADAALSQAVASGLAVKADKTELPALATSSGAGLLSAADKQKIDSLPSSFYTMPGGGAAGYFLQQSAGGAAAWSAPADAAGYLPLMSSTQKGVARLSAGGGLELGTDGSLGIKADNLLSKANVEARLSGHDTRLAGVESQTSAISPLSTRVGTLETNLSATDGRVNALTTNYNGLGAMSRVADAPSNAKPYMRQSGGWVEYVASSGSGSGGIVGEIRLLPFRKSDLPTGWYLCNGDQYALTSAQGNALNTLPSLMKSDWGITINGSNISLPNLFSGADGYFLRPVNGSSRVPGNKQTDAMRNITASFSWADTAGLALHSATLGTSTMQGAFYSPSATKKASGNGYNYGNGTVGDLYFDASRCVPVASEFRPINVGMTPAIYLGV